MGAYPGRDATREEVIKLKTYVRDSDRAVYHKKCGTAVSCSRDWYTDSYELTCAKYGCGKWDYDRLTNGKHDFQIADEMYATPPPDDTVYKLVEVQEGKTRFTKKVAVGVDVPKDSKPLFEDDLL
jgi:hypothetical protein